MGLTHVTGALKGLGSSGGSYESDFLVNTGATDCVAPAVKLREIAMSTRMHCELGFGLYRNQKV
jgi:hypothetical protein